ncbi:MAG: hydrogen peroxide-dependent heme synthase [Myxococcota bacterium]
MAQQAPQTQDGWFVLHDFRRVCWHAFHALSADRQQRMRQELSQFLTASQQIATAKTGAFALFAMAGHRSDFLLLHLRSSLKELIALERTLNCLGENVLQQSHSFVSVVELSNYTQPTATTQLSAQQRQAIRARLFPAVPNMQYVCFYPMNKLRQPDNNWYLLPLQQRQQLMKEHGMSGRKFAGRVTQMISGAMGLDDWEWGVTLFADDPVIFKQVVATMRFDEVSARYGEFGPFYVGNRMAIDPFLCLFGADNTAVK